MPDIVAAALTIRRVQQAEERETAGEIRQQRKDMPSLIFSGRYGTPIDPRTLNRKFVAHYRAGASLADLQQSYSLSRGSLQRLLRCGCAAPAEELDRW
jgi:hypothetical protein